ncbi:MAG TPA: hypothetical protein VMV31_10870 [Terriglobales bacterium]|nr:hypothetical protein [Terriglobales bacterium]
MNATKAILAAVCFLFLVQASARLHAAPPAPAPPPLACPVARPASFRLPAAASKQKGPYDYVCSCLGTSSCSCMTEAKHEGPCACGTSGGPPMRRVAANSNWAKANRIALAAK